MSKRNDMLGIGLDVGCHRARVVKLDLDDEGIVRLLSAALEKVPPPGSKPLNLRALFKAADARCCAAHCNLGSARAILHEAEFPAMGPEELAGAIRIEAEQLVPDLDEMVLDYQILPDPETEKHAAHRPKKLKIMIVAAPRNAVQERAELLDAAGLDDRSLVPDGVAIANAIMSLRCENKAPVLALDVSVSGTGVVAVDRREEVHAPVVRFIQGGILLLEDEDPGRERNRLRERWLGEIERTIEFVAGRFGASPERVLALGELASASKSAYWLESNLGKPVEVWNPLAEMVQGPHAPDAVWVQENGPHFAVAAGLALTQGR